MFSVYPFPCDDWENIYTLSYYHHQIRSMNYYPLFRVRSWNNGMRCMFLYIPIISFWLTKFDIAATLHYLGWYCIWAIFVKIFMLIYKTPLIWFTLLLNREIILICQSWKITVTWHYLGFYCTYAILSCFILMLNNDVINASWPRLHSDSTEILCWFTKLSR